MGPGEEGVTDVEFDWNGVVVTSPEPDAALLMLPVAVLFGLLLMRRPHV